MGSHIGVDFLKYAVDGRKVGTRFSLKETNECSRQTR